jgi:hypothetical protein
LPSPALVRPNRSNSKKLNFQTPAFSYSDPAGDYQFCVQGERQALKMNAATEVPSLKHWSPRGVCTRWRPRKRFCSGITCIPPTSR